MNLSLSQFNSDSPLQITFEIWLDNEKKKKKSVNWFISTQYNNLSIIVTRPISE